jgi:hypothetical protein
MQKKAIGTILGAREHPMKKIIDGIGNVYLKKNLGRLVADSKSLPQRQEELFQKYKQDMIRTQVGKDLGIEGIKNYKEALVRIPVTNFEFYEPYIERLANNESDILFPGKALYFGLTSGTNGKDSKRIPFNKGMIDVFSSFQTDVASCISMCDPSINFLTDQRLSFAARPLDRQTGKIPEGFISGIMREQTAFYFRSRAYPSFKTLLTEDWDEKISLLMKETRNKDIRIACGIPTYLITIFETILKETGSEKLIDIWPNLRHLVYGATFIGPYREKIDKLVGRPLTYFGSYIATEAPFGIPWGPVEHGEQQYMFNPNILLGFLPVEGGDRLLGVEDLCMGGEYHLHIGTPNGFINYDTKDIVRIKQVHPFPTFEVLGREGTRMNLASEKITQKVLQEAILQTQAESGIEISHFFVSPDENRGRPSYRWTLFVDEPKTFNTAKREGLALELDKALIRISDGYADCRRENAIGTPMVHCMDGDLLGNYFEQFREKGQFKMKTSFVSADDFKVFMHKVFPEYAVSLQ